MRVTKQYIKNLLQLGTRRRNRAECISRIQLLLNYSLSEGTDEYEIQEYFLQVVGILWTLGVDASPDQFARNFFRYVDSNLNGKDLPRGFIDFYKLSTDEEEG